MARASRPTSQIGRATNEAQRSSGESRFTAPTGLVAERFDVDGVEFVAFSWESVPDVSALTSAERAVFELILRGSSNAVIARARRASVRTVSNQVAAVLRKLGVGSRFELMARFAGFASP